MGIKETENEVYLLDYGLSRRYTNGTSHIRFSENVRLVGTLRYCSLNCQKGYEQSRRDDLESIAYCLIYMLKGKLPWQGTGKGKEDKKERIYDIKLSIPTAELCSGLPGEFGEYLDYCRGLKFEEKPQYRKLIKLFQNVFLRIPDCKNFDYDWNRMHCDLSKRKVEDLNNESGSNMSNFEDDKKAPPKKTSRKSNAKIQIKEANQKASPRKHPRATATTHEEEKKLLYEAKVKKKLDEPMNSSRVAGYSGIRFKVNKKRRTKSQGFVTNTNNNKGDTNFLQSKKPDAALQRPRKNHIDDAFCNFDQAAITERNHGKS